MSGKPSDNQSQTKDGFSRWLAFAERSKAISDYTDVLKDADRR
jgi:hypothetical protein